MHKYYWRGDLRLFQFVLLAALLLAPSAEVVGEQLPIKTYTTAEGLAHDRIKHIFRDSRGFLWFCTPSGLTRFDGQNFTTYTIAHGLPAQSVNTIMETQPGVYWVGTNSGGVARLDLSAGPVFVGVGNSGNTKTPPVTNSNTIKPGITVFKLDAEPRANNVWHLHQGPGGQLWAGTIGGLFRLESVNGREVFRRVILAIPEHQEHSVQIEALLEDAEGSLWIGTYLGLLRRLPDGRVIHYTIKPRLTREHVTALITDQMGRLWIGHRSGLTVFVPEPAANIVTTEPYSERVLIATMPEAQSMGGCISMPALASEARQYTTMHGLGGNYVYALHLSSQGKVWIATYGGGLTEFNEGQFRSYTTKHGLSSNVIIALGEDRGGNLWIGTNDAGVMKLIRNGFISFARVDSASEFNIQAIFQGQFDNLYVASGNKFIYQLDGGQLRVTQTNLPKEVGWSNQRQRNPIQDHAGEWWVPTVNGLYRFPRVARLEQLAATYPKAVYRKQDGLPSNNIFRIFEDSHRDIWIASQIGVLTRWERATGRFHHYAQPEGVRATARPNYFAESSQGDLWVGFHQGGLARYAAGRFTWLIEGEGYPVNEVHHLYFDRAGRLWVSTQNSLLRLNEPEVDPSRIIKYSTTEGLSHHSIRGVTEDQWGHIYIGTINGVDRLDPATGQIRYYAAAAGLKNIEIEAVLKDHRGDLWFATRLGLARLLPESDQRSSPPPVWINSLRIDGVPHAISDLGETSISGLQFPADQNNITIDFFSLAFGLSERILYQYKLETTDRDWRSATELRTVNYANLSPGSYRFLVQAVNSEGLASEIPASVAFTIIPPVWQRWWFLLLTVTLIAVIAYALHRYRLARLLELERVRTRIATDLHDDLGANLSQIAILSEVVRQRLGETNGQVSEPLALVTSAARESVDAMADIVWAINPKRDHLHDLTQRMRHFASEVLSARDIKLQFNSPDAEQDPQLALDLRREVFLIFKEAINNLMRHSDCTAAEVEFMIKDGWLTLKVSDNGRGFDTIEESHGHGLQSMRSRARKLGGELTIISQRGAGATLILEVSLVQRRAWWRRNSHMFR
ncbi:MAG: two-component regulator propeller domain-containing protein [Blastocatellales bacterium]